MIKCIVCGKQYLKENEKYHEFQECKGYDGLDPGEETIFALDFFNREEEMLENDEKLAKQLQEEEDKKSRTMLKNKEKKNKNEINMIKKDNNMKKNENKKMENNELNINLNKGTPPIP